MQYDSFKSAVTFPVGLCCKHLIMGDYGDYLFAWNPRCINNTFNVYRVTNIIPRPFLWNVSTFAGWEQMSCHVMFLRLDVKKIVWNFRVLRSTVTFQCFESSQEFLKSTSLVYSSQGSHVDQLLVDSVIWYRMITRWELWLALCFAHYYNIYFLSQISYLSIEKLPNCSHNAGWSLFQTYPLLKIGSWN